MFCLSSLLSRLGRVYRVSLVHYFFQVTSLSTIGIAPLSNSKLEVQETRYDSPEIVADYNFVIGLVKSMFPRGVTSTAGPHILAAFNFLFIIYGGCQIQISGSAAQTTLIAMVVWGAGGGGGGRVGLKFV